MIDFFKPDYNVSQWNDIVVQSLNIDYKLHGVGGDHSWGDRTHEGYTLDGNTPISFGFTLHKARHNGSN